MRLYNTSRKTSRQYNLVNRTAPGEWVMIKESLLLNQHFSIEEKEGGLGLACKHMD